MFPQEFLFTCREQKLLELLACGLTDNEIAQQLSLSPKTVQHGVASLCAKLGAKNRTHAVALGIQKGILLLPTLKADFEQN